MANTVIIEPITSNSPISFRRYTLDYDENTLTVAPEYQNDESGFVRRDALHGQWAWVIDDTYTLTLFVFIEGNIYNDAKSNYEYVLKILPNGVTLLVNGDKDFLDANKNLLNSHISMRFISAFDEFNKTVYYCRVKEFLE